MTSEKYVRIEEHGYVRRNVLKSALDTTKLLKAYENYKILRKRKGEKLKELKMLITNLKEDINVFQEKCFPSLHEQRSAEKKGKSHIPKKEEKAKSTLEGLNSELQDIERKLKEL